LYSLRHSYATMSLMDGQMDMHTLAKQMGTSIGMLEQHYSKMTATMAADRLACSPQQAVDFRATGETPWEVRSQRL